MNRLWPLILSLLGVVGVIGTLVGLEPANPWRTPLVITTILLLAAGMFATLASWIVRPRPWRILPACKELGIDRVHPSGDGGPANSRRLASAREIRVMAVAAVSLLHRQKPHFVNALRAGATIKILIASLDSQFVLDTEEAESSTRVGNISKELEVVDGLLPEFLSEARLASGGNRGHILVGRYSTHLRSSIIVCDDNWGWLTLNLSPKRAQHSCSIELTPKRGGLLSDMIAHFDRVWAIAESREAVTEVTPKQPIAQQGHGPDERGSASIGHVKR